MSIDRITFYTLFDEWVGTPSETLEFLSPNVITSLLALRCSENIIGIQLLLESIWFALPASEFNLLKNPSGFHELTNLIEC